MSFSVWKVLQGRIPIDKRNSFSAGCAGPEDVIAHSQISYYSDMSRIMRDGSLKEQFTCIS